MMARQTGFTLLEMIVVIAILGIVGTLIVVRQPWHSAGLDTQTTVRALTDALRLARSRAIAQNQDVMVTTETNSVWVDVGRPSLLPPNVGLSPRRIVFTPDGGSSGGIVLLTAGQHRITISVNWLTGRVQASESQ